MAYKPGTRLLCGMALETLPPLLLRQVQYRMAMSYSQPLVVYGELTLRAKYLSIVSSLTLPIGQSLERGHLTLLVFGGPGMTRLLLSLLSITYSSCLEIEIL